MRYIVLRVELRTVAFSFIVHDGALTDNWPLKEYLVAVGSCEREFCFRRHGSKQVGLGWRGVWGGGLGGWGGRGTEGVVVNSGEWLSG